MESNKITNTVKQSVVNKINTTAPSVSVLACGGCGINLLRLGYKDLVHQVSDVRRYDTSTANLRDGEEYIPVANGDGSGKVRAEHAGEVPKVLAALSDGEIGLCDINIVLFSLAGGSGSVIGPLLIKDIERRGGKAVAMVVSSTVSEQDTVNSLKTLQSLHSIVTSSNIYLPISIFSNSAGEHVVNVTLTHRLRQLVWMLTYETTEIDKQDRRNFLNGMKTVKAMPGLRLLHMTFGKSDDDNSGEVWEYTENTIYDSVLNIGVIDPESTVNRTVSHDMKTRTMFSGVFKDIENTPMLAAITSDDSGVAALMGELDSSISIFKAQSKNVTTSITGGDTLQGDEDTGLIL